MRVFLRNHARFARHGPERHHTGRLPIVTASDDLVALLDRLGIKQVIVVACRLAATSRFAVVSAS